MNVSLKEFLKTGRFGSVSLGMGRAQVESLLGTPDEVGGTSRKYRNPSIWKYGDVEFHFVVGADELSLIHLDDFTIPSGGKSISLDPWVFSDSLTLAEAQTQFSRSNLSFQVKQSDEGASFLIAGAGVQLVFSNGETCLQTVSYSIEAAN